MYVYDPLPGLFSFHTGLEMDIRALQFEDDSFDVVLDKGGGCGTSRDDSLWMIACI